MTPEELSTRFTHHPPKGDQAFRYGEIRNRAHALAALINEMAPESEEKKTAIHRLEEAVMWANAAIARRE